MTKPASGCKDNRRCTPSLVSRSSRLSANPAITPFTLTGAHVRLEPLRTEHASMLWGIAKDHLEDLFQWIPYQLKSLEDFQEFNRSVLAEQARGVSLPFATFESKSNHIVG